jgi:hypothetical protein
MFEASYGVVEAALVEAYRIPNAARAAFRGRVTALQKGGLLGVTPGKGKWLRYTPDHFHRMVFACEMLEFGVSPSTVLSIVKARWDPRLRKIFAAAERPVLRQHDAGPDDVILHMGGVHMMADGWSDAVPNVNSCPLRKLPDHMALWMRTPIEHPGSAPRVLVVNLSMRLRAFHTALSRFHMDELRAERDADKVEARADRGAGRRKR